MVKVGQALSYSGEVGAGEDDNDDSIGWCYVTMVTVTSMAGRCGGLIFINAKR